MLIGINQYPMLVGHDLRGCVDDILVARELLRDRAGFAERDITLLRDRDATRVGILEALAALARASGPGDQALVYYAGHGSQLRDRDGVPYETLVPHDSGRGRNPNRDITDIELGAWLRTLAERTPYVTLIFDCCHSGTLTRDLYGDTCRAAPAEERPIDFPRGPAGAAAQTRRAGTRVTLVPPSDRYVVISACLEHEKAYEFAESSTQGKVFHGALSFYLLRALLEIGPRETYRDLFERVAAPVTREQPKQHPRCEGALDRLVLGTGMRPTPRYVLMSAGDAGALTLGAGAVHGVVPGSEWDLYPPSALPEDGPAAPLGRARVEAVGALQATASMVDSATVALPARAIEVLRPEGEREPRWPVEVRGATAAIAALLPVLGRSRWVRPAQPGEISRLCVAVGTDRWVVLGRDGAPRLARSGLDPGEPGLLAICDGLERLVQQERVRLLANDQSPLCGQIAVGLLRRRGADAWEEVPRGEGGASLVNEGDFVALRLRSRADKRLHATVLWLGMGLGISQLWPPRGAQAIEAGTQINVGGWPMSRPKEPAVPLPPGEPALDLLKVLVTRREVDFSPLLQGNVRGPGPADGQGPLWRLLQQTLHGKATRAPVPAQTPEEEDWASELHEVLVRPSTP